MYAFHDKRDKMWAELLSEMWAELLSIMRLFSQSGLESELEGGTR